MLSIVVKILLADSAPLGIVVLFEDFIAFGVLHLPVDGVFLERGCILRLYDSTRCTRLIPIGLDAEVEVLVLRVNGLGGAPIALEVEDEGISSTS